jgi:hypothetical protein
MVVVLFSVTIALLISTRELIAVIKVDSAWACHHSSTIEPFAAVSIDATKVSTPARHVPFIL